MGIPNLATTTVAMEFLLWRKFDDEWLDMTVNGLPKGFGSDERRIRSIGLEADAA